MMNILIELCEQAFVNKCENPTPTSQSRYCIEYAHIVLYPVVSNHVLVVVVFDPLDTFNFLLSDL